MSNSSLVSYTKISPNRNSPRNHAIDRITPHCVVGQLSAEGICGLFTNSDKDASCNYAIGTDGKIGLCVEEKDRSWCSSSKENDHRAVTIECACDKTDPYAMTDAVYQSLINLCIDICRRNGKNTLLWFGDKDKTLSYEPKENEMVLTVHRWFAAKACPGDWLYSRLGDLAAKVTAQLGGGGTSESPSGGYSTGLYKVNVDDLNIRTGPGTGYTPCGSITDRGTYTIVEIQNTSWGKLKSGAGWINCSAKYCTYAGAAAETPAKPADETFLVSVKTKNLRIRKGPGTNYGVVGYCPIGTYTIVETAQAYGYTWGRLKSGSGWIALEYTDRV